MAIILAIMYLLERLDTKSLNKATEKVAEVHEKFYNLIDEHYDGYEARERKAQVDTMIAAYWKDNGREYNPIFDQVTTKTERKERVKRELGGTSTDAELVRAKLLDIAYDNDKIEVFNDEDVEYTQEQKRELFIHSLMKSGNTRAEAEVKADRFYGFLGL